jgi:hypothetical protein
MTHLTPDQLAQIQGGNIANMFGHLPNLIQYVKQTGLIQAYFSTFGATPNASQYNAMGDYGN